MEKQKNTELKKMHNEYLKAIQELREGNNVQEFGDKEESDSPLPHFNKKIQQNRKYSPMTQPQELEK